MATCECKEQFEAAAVRQLLEREEGATEAKASLDGYVLVFRPIAEFRPALSLKLTYLLPKKAGGVRTVKKP